MRGKFRLKLLVCCCILALAGAFAQQTEAKQEELIVSAAASLTDVFQEMGSAFEMAHPGIRVVFNFAASGALLQQIHRGAPVDVFAPADQKSMDRALEKGLLRAGTRRNFASNRLVLVTPGRATSSIEDLQELTKEEIAWVSIGNPETVPAGWYAKQIVILEGLWETLQPKLIFAESVRQVLDYLNRGEVDAGFVYETDAAISAGKVKLVAVLDQGEAILYPFAALAASRKQDLAQRFMEFVTSEEGRTILATHGFGNP